MHIDHEQCSLCDPYDQEMELCSDIFVGIPVCLLGCCISLWAFEVNSGFFMLSAVYGMLIIFIYGLPDLGPLGNHWVYRTWTTSRLAFLMCMLLMCCSDGVGWPEEEVCHRTGVFLRCQGCAVTQRQVCFSLILCFSVLQILLAGCLLNVCLIIIGVVIGSCIELGDYVM